MANAIREKSINPQIAEAAVRDKVERGSKHNCGKPKMNLLSPIALAFVGQVLTFGAKKYGDHNWRKGIPKDELIASSMNHLLHIMAGSNLDEESGLPHSAHLMCNAMFMCEQEFTSEGVQLEQYPSCVLAFEDRKFLEELLSQKFFKDPAIKAE